MRGITEDTDLVNGSCKMIVETLYAVRDANVPVKNSKLHDRVM